MRALLTTLTLTIITSQANAVTVALDAHSKPTEVKGLVVGTSVFDATFTYDISFDDLYGTDPIPSTLPFQMEVGVIAFGEALRSVLTSMNIAPEDPSGRAEGLRLPVAELMDIPGRGSGWELLYDDRRDGKWNFHFDRWRRGEALTAKGYAEVTLVGFVPEPHTFILAALAGGTLLRRRRSLMLDGNLFPGRGR